MNFVELIQTNLRNNRWKISQQEIATFSSWYVFGRTLYIVSSYRQAHVVGEYPVVSYEDNDISVMLRNDVVDDRDARVQWCVTAWWKPRWTYRQCLTGLSCYRHQRFWKHEYSSKWSPSRATWAHWAALISVSLVLSQTPAYTSRPQIRGCCSARCACLLQAFAGTHCAYPRRDGQAEFINININMVLRASVTASVRAHYAN